MKLFNNLPEELSCDIALRLDLPTRGQSCRVCKAWKVFMEQDIFWQWLLDHGFCLETQGRVSFPLVGGQTIKNYLNLHNASSLESITTVLKRWADTLIANQHRRLIGLFPNCLDQAALERGSHSTFKMEIGCDKATRQFHLSKTDVLTDYIIINPKLLPQMSTSHSLGDWTWNMPKEKAKDNSMDKYGTTKFLKCDIHFHIDTLLAPLWTDATAASIEDILAYLKLCIERQAEKNELCMLQ